jgi:ribosomal protein S18 acetylase RimI-like enzyme
VGASSRYGRGVQEAVIRPVSSAEYDVAGELVVEAYRTLEDVGDEFYEQELRDVQGRVATGEVLVAEIDGQVVGCVTFAVGQTALSQVEDPDSATIRMLGVSPKARGRGIGEALVHTCIERARSSGKRRVRLDTRTSMASAQRLYERLGFHRDPEHDWSPAPGISLLAYVLDLDAPRHKPSPN